MRLREREALFPRMRKSLALRAPTVEELARERGGRLDFGNHVFRSEHERDRAVTGRLLGFALGRCQTAIANRHQRALRTAADRIGALQQSRHARAHRARQVSCANLQRQLGGCADHRSAEFFRVRRRRGCEDESLHLAGRRLQRVARGLDRHRDAVLVEARNRALTLAGRRAEHGRDRRALESSIGNVRTVRNNSSHGRH